MTVFKNTIVYLYGFAGVGKLTIAKELCRYPNFRLIDNHAQNNVVFPFVRVDGKSALPKEIWPITKQIRDIALETMITLGNRDFSYVFTNYLTNDEPNERRIYNEIEEAAKKIDALFLPVRLVITDKEEHKRRMMSPDREVNMKATDPNFVDDMHKDDVLISGHPNEQTIDVTHLKPDEVATKIIKALEILS